MSKKKIRKAILNDKDALDKAIKGAILMKNYILALELIEYEKQRC